MARRRAVGSNGIVMRRFDRVSPTTVPRRHRGRLTGVAREHDEPHTRIAARDRARGGDRAVAAAVVDEHDLVRAAHAGERFVRRGAKPCNVVLLVVERDYDRDLSHRATALALVRRLQISYCKNENLPPGDTGCVGANTRVARAPRCRLTATDSVTGGLDLAKAMPSEARRRMRSAWPGVIVEC